MVVRKQARENGSNKRENQYRCTLHDLIRPFGLRCFGQQSGAPLEA
jgi:hypothetical protein